jgi:hypothetical protein
MGGFEWAGYIPVEEGRLTEAGDNPGGSVAGVISAERHKLGCTEARRAVADRRMAGATAGERGAETAEGRRWGIGEQGTGISANGGCKPFGQRPARNCYQIYRGKGGVTNANESVLQRRLIVCSSAWGGGSRSASQKGISLPARFGRSFPRKRRRVVSWLPPQSHSRTAVHPSHVSCPL